MTKRTENYLIIITACIPTLKPLYQKTSQFYYEYRSSQKHKHQQDLTTHSYNTKRNHFRGHDQYDSITELTNIESVSRESKPASDTVQSAV